MAGEVSVERVSIFEPAASAGLFIGVSAFEDGRIAPIPFAVDDAVDLAYLFVTELRLVPPENAVLLLAGEPQKTESTAKLMRLMELGVHRQEARQREIYRLIGELSRASSAAGIFILTAATHGLSDQGGDFLLASDSLRARTLRTGVAVAELFDEVGRAGAERRLVLLDACRERLTQGTRGIEGSAMSKSFVKAIGRTKGMVILSGATLGGYSYDDPSRKNGVFTSAVLDGLGGEASPGPEGWITVRTLADFVQQRVMNWVRRNCPEDTRSLGIGRQIEATAEELPLAPHPRMLSPKPPEPEINLPDPIAALESAHNLYNYIDDIDDWLRRSFTTILQHGRMIWRNRSFWWVLGICITALVAVILVLTSLKNLNNQAHSAAESPSFAAPVASSPITSMSPAPAPSTAPIQVSLDFSHDCWVEAVIDGGKHRFAELRVQGESLPLEAEKSISLTLGNAGAVDVQVNGYPLPLGKKEGDVVHDLIIDLGTVQALKAKKEAR